MLEFFVMSMIFSLITSAQIYWITRLNTTKGPYCKKETVVQITDN